MQIHMEGKDGEDKQADGQGARETKVEELKYRVRERNTVVVQSFFEAGWSDNNAASQYCFPLRALWVL